MKKFIICALCAICGFTTANAQAKFGHVNTQEIIQAMPEFSTARTDIEKLTQQYEADLKSMQDELQKKAEAFETCPRISRLVVTRSCRISISVSSRLIKTTSRLLLRLSRRRCRLSPPRSSMLSRLLVRRVAMYT